MLKNAFELGGFGMYPTLIFGVLAIGMAGWYAVSPERRRLIVMGFLSALTLMAGLLGTITGVMKSIQAAADLPNMGHFIALGTYESLYCLWFSLVLIILAGIAGAVGAWRSAPRGDASASPSQSPALS